MLPKPDACKGCPFYGRGWGFVPPHGPEDADILMLAESPGENEEREGVPLVGKAGWQFNGACSVNGINRDRTLIVNTILCRPPKQANLHDSQWIKAINHCARAYTQPLFNRVRPKVVLTMGGPAMYRVTGFQAHSVRHGKYTIPLHGIETARGSAWRASEIAAGGPINIGLDTPTWGGADPWIVSTLHPAYIARGNSHVKMMFWADFGKAKRFAEGRADMGTPPTLADFDLMASAPPPSDWDRLAFDIETDAEDRADLVGLGCRGKVNVYHDVEAARTVLRERDTLKWGHNMCFDVKGLGGIHQVKRPWADTIVAAHLCQPAFPRSLAEVASIYGSDWYFYWKDMVDNPRTYAVVASRLSLPRFFLQKRELYNALDVWWTDHIAPELVTEMRYMKLTDLFRETQMKLLPELIEIERVGMPINEAERKRIFERTEDELVALTRQVHEMVGARAGTRRKQHEGYLEAVKTAITSEIETFAGFCPDHPAKRSRRPTCACCMEVYARVSEIKKKFEKERTKARGKVKKLLDTPFNVASDHDWAWLFFTSKPIGLGLKTRMKTKAGKLSLNKNALRGLLALANLTEEQRTFVMARFRMGQLDSRLEKYLSTENIAADGRIHPPYSITVTVTGRSASGLDDTDSDKPSSRTKINAQNWPPDVRRIVSTQGMVYDGYDDWRLVNADYSAIEAWMSAIRVHQVTHRREYWDFLLSTPDPHRLTADRVAALTHTNCSRYQGKRCRHMWTYRASPKMVAIILAGDMVTYELAVAVDEVLAGMHPDVIEWWERQIKAARRDTTLRNPLGRLCHFSVRKAETEEGVDIEDPNSLIAWWPQSTAHDIAKRAWVRFGDWMPDLAYRPYLINHAHDNFMFMVREPHVEDFAARLKTNLERPVEWLRTPDGGPFVPRVEVQIGKNWGDWHQHGTKCEKEPFHAETAPGCTKEENLDGLR